MEPKDSHYGFMKHILRLPRTGQHFQLVAATAAKQASAPHFPVQLTDEQCQSLLAEVELIAPGDWPALWRDLKPVGQPPLTDPDRIRTALA